MPLDQVKQFVTLSAMLCVHLFCKSRNAVSSALVLVTRQHGQQTFEVCAGMPQHCGCLAVLYNEEQFDHAIGVVRCLWLKDMFEVLDVHVILLVD